MKDSRFEFEQVCLSRGYYRGLSGASPANALIFAMPSHVLDVQK